MNDTGWSVTIRYPLLPRGIEIQARGVRWSQLLSALSEGMGAVRYILREIRGDDE